MSAIVRPDEEECYLYAILAGAADGIDLAEFAVEDTRNPGGRYRLRDYQWPWFSCTDMKQIDCSARAVGKTESIKLRALAFPFVYPGRGMLLTAPELNHLAPLTSEVERVLLDTWVVRAMLPDEKSAGIRKQPHWEARFKNGTSIVSRLPNKDGKGIKGQHVTQLEIDECFPAGTLIATRRGQVPIEDVVVGDLVWTHRGRWREVTDTISRGPREAIFLKGHGSSGMICTPNHKFWARRVLSYGNARDRQSPTLADAPEWVPAREMLDAHWSAPVRMTGPPAPMVIPKARTGSSYELKAMGEEFAWFLGHYVAEGSTSSSYGAGRAITRFTLSVHVDEVPEVTERLDAAGIHNWIVSNVMSSENCKNVVVNHCEIARFLARECGSGARNKRVPPFVFSWPNDWQEAFLDGLLYGDGNVIKDPLGRYRVRRSQLATSSKALALGVKALTLGLGYSVSIHALTYEKCGPRYIRGHLVKSPGTYAVVIGNYGMGETRGGARWTKVKKMAQAETVEMYDLTVDEDHSFVADGIIVSNSQDYPKAGWVEIVECLNSGDEGAMWRCHGVTRGVRDSFWEKTQPGSGWTVHRYVGMHRDTWSPEERDAKIIEYGGSRSSVSYRRNVLGEHCSAANSVFLLANLVDRTDLDEASPYNNDVYRCIRLAGSMFDQGMPDEVRASIIRSMIDIPESHFRGYSQKVGGREVGSPRGYSAYWAGQDVGMIQDPSEVILTSQRVGEDFLEVILRIQMKEINATDQKLVVQILFETYGDALRGFGIDKTGQGRPIWDELTRYPFGDRIYGFDFGEKYIESFEERQLRDGETMKDLARKRLFKEISTDLLRNKYIDGRMIRFPSDREISLEWSGVTYHTVLDPKDPYTGRKVYSGGSLHTLDAGRVMVGAIHIPPLEAMLEVKEEQAPVLDYFPGAMVW
jgi:hypothetical protein